MKADEYIQKVSKKFSDDNLQVKKDRINNQEVLVANKSEFRWSWLATKLQIFACVSSKDRITKGELQEYSKSCLDYAKSNMHGMRGMQTGAVSFAVLASESIDDDTKEWVQQIPPKHFALMEFPVIYDLKEDKLYYCEKTPFFGWIYFKFFRSFVKMYFN
jgi:hypothetical protein